MTNEEAIKILKENRETYQAFINQGYEDNEDNKDIKRVLLALDMAIEALEKQMPKKVAADIYDDGEVSHICLCGAEVEENQAYCDVCGQALDWSGEDD